MKSLLLPMLALCLLLPACKDDPTTPQDPQEQPSGPPPAEEPTPGPTPAPVPTPGAPLAWWKPGPLKKGFQIFHFDGLKDFKSELKPVDAVTLELEQIEGAGGKAVTDYAHSLGVKVICYFSEGYEDWRDDADQYPRDAMGDAMDDWDGEAWGDPRKDSWLAFQTKRVVRSVGVGCDAVEADNMDQDANAKEAGLNITKAQNIAAQKRFADVVHSHGLAIVAKNSPHMAEELAPHFDGVWVEECGRYKECDDYLPYKGKAVAMVEYGTFTSCKPFEGAVCQKKSGYFK